MKHGDVFYYFSGKTPDWGVAVEGGQEAILTGHVKAGAYNYGSTP